MSYTSINKESLPSFAAGNGTVGTSEALLSASSVPVPVQKHIVVRASAANGSETITVGVPGNAAAGFVLAAGEQTPPIYIDSTDKVAVVGSAAGQDYSWIGN